MTTTRSLLDKYLDTGNQGSILDSGLALDDLIVAAVLFASLRS
jgi:hypothetical protein